MKIYIAHTRTFDFKKELYNPIRNSELNTEHEIVLPHEKTNELFNSKELFEEECDLVIAEVSDQSIALGIELGWANILLIPIICVYKEGSEPSDSLSAVSSTIIKYSDEADLIVKLKKAVSEL